MGCVDSKGKLVGIHGGQGEMLSIEYFPEFSGYDAEWDNLFLLGNPYNSRYFSSKQNITTIDQNCFEKWNNKTFKQLRRVTELTSRNPTTIFMLVFGRLDPKQMKILTYLRDCAPLPLTLPLPTTPSISPSTNIIAPSATDDITSFNANGDGDDFL
jgi:hypothetical protein